jgi:hypothetical protein
MLDELTARKARAQGELNQWLEQADAAAAATAISSGASKKPPIRYQIVGPKDPTQGTAAPKPAPTPKKGGGK